MSRIGAGFSCMATEFHPKPSPTVKCKSRPGITICPFRDLCWTDGQIVGWNLAAFYDPGPPPHTGIWRRARRSRVLGSSPLASDGAAWPPRRLSLRRNTNVMKTHASQGRTAESRISKFPAYPWSGHQIMAALRARLAGAEQTGSLSFDRLARLVGPVVLQTKPAISINA